MADQKKGITIVGVEVSNFHRLTFAQVQLVPGTGLVRVTGKNGAGKTSLLRSIRSALGGAGEVLPDTIHEGGDEGGRTRLTLSNGFTVTRRFTESHPKGYLTVEGPDGGQFKQGKLDEWLGTLSFDPLAFYDLKPERQREILLSLGGDDQLPAKLAAIRAKYAEKYAERTPWIAQKRKANQVEKPAGERPQPVDISAELQRMGELQAIERERQDLIRSHERAVEQARARAATALERGQDAMRESLAEVKRAEEAVGRWQSEVQRLEAALAEAREQLGAAKVARDRAVETKDDIRVRYQQLPDPDAEASSVPRPDMPADPAGEMAEVQARVAAADGVLAALEPWKAFDRARAELEEASRAIDAITAVMDDLEQEEEALIASAGIPVEGLGFSPDGEPLLNGRALAVASGAERIRLSVAVALAANPQLRICLVDEANDLDLDACRALDEQAKEHGFQIWCARIGLEGKGEIHIVDGHTDEPELVEAAS